MIFSVGIFNLLTIDRIIVQKKGNKAGFCCLFYSKSTK